MPTWTLVIIALAAVGAAMALTGSALQTRRETAAQLASVRRRLDLIIDHLGLADAAPERAEVLRHLENGQLVAAVRAYRQETGASLLEAKQAVDRLAAEHGHNKQ